MQQQVRALHGLCGPWPVGCTLCLSCSAAVHITCGDAGNRDCQHMKTPVSAYLSVLWAESRAMWGGYRSSVNKGLVEWSEQTGGVQHVQMLPVVWGGVWAPRQKGA